MAKYSYFFSQVSLDSIISRDSLSIQDSNLVSTSSINTSFDQVSDFVEVHYYSLDGRLLQSKKTSTNLQTNQDSETANNRTLNTLTLRVQDDLLQEGYEFGDVYLLYNFLNNSFSDKGSNPEFFIEEISNDRQEIRLLSRNLSNEFLISRTSTVKQRLGNPDTLDYFLNLGSNRLLLLTNIDTLLYKDLQSVVVRLYNPLPEDIQVKTILSITEKVADSVGYQAFAELIEEPLKVPYLKGPNYSVNVEDDTEQPSQFFNIDELFGYPITNSFYEVKSSFEEKGAELSIDYSDYSNFINFSSAQERLANFRYKVNLLDSYQSLRDSAVNANNNTAGAVGSKEYYENLINTVLANFDHYDRYLYYESSSYAWPKSGTRKPYTLITGTQADNWYTAQYLSASAFDTSNPYSLENTIPEFLREDPNNSKYVKFVHMIGQHFDNLWLYTKAVSDKYDGDNRLNHGLSKDLIQDALKNFGVKLYNSNKSTEELFNIFTGDFYQLTSEEFGDRLNDATFITGSNLSTSEENYRKEIYKRLYHNLPLITKAKGTERGIRALLSSFGVPSLYSSGSHSGLNLIQIGGTISGSFNLGGDQYVSSSLDRIRVDNTGSVVTGNTLSPYTSIVRQNFKYAKDSNLVEAGFSPANYLNNLIIASASIDGFDLDSILGDPRLEASSSYEALKVKAAEYLTPVSSSIYDLRDFIRLLKFYDNVLFKTIADFLPARTNVSTGIIIKPHLLERSKIKIPQTSRTLHTYSGSIPIGAQTGSYAGIYQTSFGDKDTAYSQSAMTPNGPTLLPYHTHNEARFDGELSGSKLTLTTGELNDENIFKYENPNNAFYKINTAFNCNFIITVSGLNTSLATPTPTITETATPTVSEIPTETPTPTVSETPCRTMDATPYTYGYNATDLAIACAQTTTRTVYTTGNLPAVGVVLYNDIQGCDPADLGYYSDGTSYFNVDQFGEILSSGNCGTTPAPGVSYEVGFRTSTGYPIKASACDNTGTILYANTPNFANISAGNNIIIYTDQNNPPTVLQGGDTWFGIAAFNSTATKVIQVSNSGLVTDDDDQVCDPPVTTYYRFQKCDITQELVFQALQGEPNINDRYTDGTDNYIYIGPPTTQPGTIVTNLTGPTGTNCSDPVPTPTPTPTYENIILYAESAIGTQGIGWNTGEEACANTGTAFTSLFYPYGDNIANTVIYTNSDLTDPFDGNLKWFSDPSSTYAIKIGSNGTTNNGYLDCNNIPTPTPTPTQTPTPTVYSFTVRYDATSNFAACSSTDPTITIYSNCQTITTPGEGTCYLYTDFNNPAGSYVDGGYYADTLNSQYYYVEGNGNGIVQEVGGCSTPAPTTQPVTCFGITVFAARNEADLCNALATQETGYFNTNSVETATVYYGQTDCSTPFPFAKYFDIGGNQYYLWQNGVMSGPFTCEGGAQ